MPATTSKEFVISVENEPGTFADLTTALAKENINVSGFLREGRGEFGILRLVTDNPDATEAMLRAARRTFRTNEVVSVRVANRPGELARIAQLLAASGVHVNAAYSTAGPDGAAELTFAVDDVRSARKVFGHTG